MRPPAVNLPQHPIIINNNNNNNNNTTTNQNPAIQNPHSLLLQQYRPPLLPFSHQLDLQNLTQQQRQIIQLQQNLIQKNQQQAHVYNVNPSTPQNQQDNKKYMNIVGRRFFRELVQIQDDGGFDADEKLLVDLVEWFSARPNIDQTFSCRWSAILRRILEKMQKFSEVYAQNPGGTTAMGASCNTEDKLKEIDAIISSVVGLEGVKLQLRKWVKGLVLYEKRKTHGFKVGNRKALHMAFLGNPGTGKTMVARILGNILHKLGLISTNKVTEVQRTDLVAEYIGQTGPRTRRKIGEAKGGILFVGEAYRLMPRDMPRDFGIEALEEIMSAMDRGDIVTIFAGYSKDMERVISSNAGFARRVSKFFYFDNYSTRDIALILQSKIDSEDENSFIYGFKLHPDCTVEAMARLIREHTPEELLKKMNGGLVDPLLVNTMENMDLRLDTACTDDKLITITMKDLEEGLRSLSSCGGAFFNDQVKLQNSRGTTAMRESCDIEDNLKEIDAIISAIVGLEGIKIQLRKWVKGLILYEKRKTLGFEVGTRKALHMAFLGNPGTGKTMVARILGKILYKLGYISSYTVTEVQRTDLVGEYIGQTGPRTRRKIEEAQGGILFVDEAYRLMPRDMPRDFGIEALEEIMSAMDNGDIVAIFAGYSEDMERVISSNSGFARRVTKFLYFNDYTPRDIALILRSKINTLDKNSFIYGFKLHHDCTLKAMTRLIRDHTTEELLKKMNGGLVDPLLVSTLENMDLRLDMACTDDKLMTITMKDLEAGLKSLSNSNEKSFSFEEIFDLIDD